MNETRRLAFDRSFSTLCARAGRLLGRAQEPPLKARRSAGPFTLTDQDGRQVTTRLRGRYSHLFRLTTCPASARPILPSSARRSPLRDEHIPSAPPDRSDLRQRRSGARTRPCSRGLCVRLPSAPDRAHGNAEAGRRQVKSYGAYGAKDPRGRGAAYNVNHSRWSN